MFKKRLLLCIVFITCQLAAKANFNFNSNCVEAYKAILSLKINEAKLLVQKEKQQNPQNGMAVLLDNYIDYFSLLASENKTDYERLKDNKAARILALAQNDNNSPYYLYAQAQVYLQWAFLKAKFADYSSSAFDAKKAASLLNENTEKYPDFLPNKISLALVNIIFGSIPANLKWVTNFLGMEGNAQAGIKQLEQLKAELPKTKYSYYNDEVIFFISTAAINVTHNFNDYSKLSAYLLTMETGSLLKVYLQAYMASKTAHNDDVLTCLQALPPLNQYIALPALYYMLANAQLNRMDNDDAPVYFNKYLAEYKGTSFIKDAYLKLAYFYLLHDDADKYQYYLNMVRTKGYAFDGKDKLALKEANGAGPDIALLKARFYFDGGYYNKALTQLINKTINSFKLPRDKTEFYYRLGRIYDKLNNPTEALLNYQQAINTGKNTSYYYAANAAMLTGNIYEALHDDKKAAYFYNQALGMPSHDYQTDIDNDAKAGLKRIGR